jgi:hypothetical protein
MKHFILLVTILFSFFSQAGETIYDRVDKLVPVLVKVESSGRNDAVGDRKSNAKGNSANSYFAWGCLQLHKVYVDDVNRISGKKYEHCDAFDRKKAEEIVKIYLVHYGKHYERKTGKPASLEILSRIHNGGPNGYAKKSTVKYWAKVKKSM